MSDRINPYEYKAMKALGLTLSRHYTPLNQHKSLKNIRDEIHSYRLKLRPSIYESGNRARIDRINYTIQKLKKPFIHRNIDVEVSTKISWSTREGGRAGYLRLPCTWIRKVYDLGIYNAMYLGPRYNIFILHATPININVHHDHMQAFKVIAADLRKWEKERPGYLIKLTFQDVSYNFFAPTLDEAVRTAQRQISRNIKQIVKGKVS